jgi:hypothetical protein
VLPETTTYKKSSSKTHLNCCSATLHTSITKIKGLREKRSHRKREKVREWEREACDSKKEWKTKAIRIIKVRGIISNCWRDWGHRRRKQGTGRDYSIPVSYSIAWVSRPDLRDPFNVSFLVWSGRELGWAFYVLCSMISISLCLAGYGSQSGTAVYRCLWWETILRYPFSHLCLWEVDSV